MAMVSASTGAMNSVLSKLAALLKEYKLKKGIRRNVQLLLDELTSMNGLLKKLADKEDHDPLVRGWMRQVRDMTYDLDDGIDLFVISSAESLEVSSAQQRRFKRFVSKISNIMKKAKSRHQITDLVKELKVRVHEASERSSRYKLHVAADACPAMSVDPRRTAIYENASSLVGIDGQREKLFQLLRDGQPKLKAVPVVGFAGLGKTTLALNVYRKIQADFECVAFISVSQQPDIKKIFVDMVHQVGAQQAAVEWKLIDALREHLLHKRYFMVIDDVWSASTWNTIKNAFPENDLGSRILVTTRIMTVAESCCYPENIFHMRPLTDSEARALFFRRIFDSEEGCPPQLAEIPNNILKKCGGLPLAIITVANLLANRQHSTEQWESIINSVHSPLDASMGDIRQILNLSYTHLPFELKTCLLYLSMLPEDYVIDRKRLVRRWIAEGFIGGDCGNLEKVGEYYLNELINGGLVQPVGVQYDSRVDACQVHDMVLDLIISKSVEDNFVITYGEHGHISGLQDKVRRLSLDCRNRRKTFVTSEVTTLHVRSLTIIGSNVQMPPLANFRALRVLDIEDYEESESQYIRSIGRLDLLKYLRFHTKSVIELPQAIGELQYLETLDLNGAPRSILPKSIVRLRKLIHLCVRNVKLPDRLGSIHSLQELSCVEIDSGSSADFLRELGNLIELETLGLNWCIREDDTNMESCVDGLVSSLSKLITSNLQSLCIESAGGCSLDFLLDVISISGNHLREFQMNSDYFFPTVPNYVSSLEHLTLLHINIETVGEEVLEILGKLPALLALFLQLKSTASEKGLVIRSKLFACLKQFDLVCSNCRVGMLMFEPDAMVTLEKLRFVFSAQEEFLANGFHFGIQHLPSLKHLMVEIDCVDARGKDVNAAEDAINNAVSNHPKPPTLELRRLGEEQHIVKDEREIAVEGEEEEGQNEGDNDGVHDLVVEGKRTPATES